MPKYTALTRIAVHKGASVAIGQSIEMTSEEAAPYLRSKVIVPDTSVADARTTTVPSGSGDDTTLPRSGTSPRTEERTVVMSTDDEASGDAGGYDTLTEQAIRAFGADDFTKEGEPRMSRLRDAVQKLAHPNDAEIGIVLEVTDRDRVFKAMIGAGFEVPKAATESGGT